MLTRLKSFIQKNNLFESSEKVILAVSGGVDSMVLAYLFHKAGFNFDMAHCNFALRGKEADMDEALVKKIAAQYQVTFYSKKFDTKKYAADQKISIQMAARDLRYSWFDELHQNKQCNYVALAHHKNDVAETLLINLIRGTGISGLHGIRAKNNIFIRPLLFTDKAEIETFAKTQGIEFRNDMSNFEEKYTRNKLRNKIIPLLETINPSVVTSLCDTASHLLDVENIYRSFIENQKEALVIKKEQLLTINVNKLQKNDYKSVLLYEILSPFNFNASQVNDILEALDGISGKVFFTPTHKLLKDREQLIVEPLKQEDAGILLIYENENTVKAGNNTLSLTSFVRPLDFNPFSASPNTVFLDFDQVKFPLTLRPWVKGDSFMPLGMKKKKKISDFLIDNKVTLFQKENVKLLCADNIVVWLVGMRADERFKITPETKLVLKIDIL